jgi:K+-sensing histidine kinase KdpD
MDITDLKLAEQELLVARDEAEQSSRAKSDFISNVSHELRTPMNAIIGMTHLALQDELTDKQHGYLNKVKLSSEALNNLIQGMLDFSDIDAGALTLANIEFELKQIVENLLAVARATATNKGLELKVLYDDDLPALLRGDPDRLRQILMSLLDNAIKYTEEGEIILHLKKIKDYQDKVLLEFSISDTGIGFKQSSSDKLFQAFTQGDASSTRSVGGTGLGLALCKELVEIMGGEINAQSEPGKGSTFTFTAEFVQLTGQVITDITNDDAEYSVSSEKAISEVEGEISIDSSTLEPVLIELDHLLMEGDTEASEQLDRIEGYLCGAGFRPQVEVLKRQIENYDFNDARKTLSEIEKLLNVSLAGRK